MALRILILVCSLTVTAATPSHPDAITGGPSDHLSCKPSGVSPNDGHAHPLVGYCEDLFRSSPWLSDRDDDEASEEDFPTPAFAIRQVGEIHLAIALFFPAPPSPRAAQSSSWRPPLRC